MKIQIIELDGEFTSLNPYIDAERAHRMKAAEIKKAETYRVQIETLGTLPIPPEMYPLKILFNWFCENEKTDPDNIQFATKFILDGLVVGKILQGDGWKFIRSLQSEFYVDKKRPRVVMYISKFIE